MNIQTLVNNQPLIAAIKHLEIIAALVLMAVVLMVGFNHALTHAERIECNQWQSEANLYSDYYVTHWQIAQCNHVGLPLDGIRVSD